MVDSGWLRLMLRELNHINTHPTRAERLKLRCKFYLGLVLACAVSGGLLVTLLGLVRAAMHPPAEAVLAIAGILYYLIVAGVISVCNWYSSRRK